MRHFHRCDSGAGRRFVRPSVKGSFGTLFVLGSFACCTALQAATMDMPPRKSGLWSISVQNSTPGVPPILMQQCIDPTSDKAMNSFGTSMASDACPKQDMRKEGGKIIVDAVCNFGQMKIVSHSEVTGSFDSAYTVKTHSKHEGASPARGMPADTDMTIEAKWVGACKPDQKPGDMIMSNGMKMNVLDMHQRMKSISRTPRPPAPH
jgi:hypothetical protein